MLEFCSYAHAAKPTDDTPHIEECIQLFNGLTIWVVCNILRELTMVKRAVIIEKFVDCTKVCGRQSLSVRLSCSVCISTVSHEASVLQHVTGRRRWVEPLLHSAAEPDLVQSGQGETQ